MSETKTIKIEKFKTVKGEHEINARYWGDFETSDIKTIGGEAIIEKGGGDIDMKDLVEITYGELKILKEKNELTPGRQYRITDYVTTILQKNTKSAGYQFDIIVTADDKNTLNEVARACLNKNDTYFKSNNANLSAWKIWYCFDNDFNRFSWANSNGSVGKGVIYRMIDEFNNDCPYDFKNIKFARMVNSDGGIAPVSEEMPVAGDETVEYFYTFSFIDAGNILDLSLIGGYLNNTTIQNGVRDNIIKPYIGSNVNGYISCQFLNDIVFVNKYNGTTGKFSGCYSNVFGNDCYSNTFGSECYCNKFDNGCYNNTLGDNCCGNSFGDGCQKNNIDSECNENTFGHKCLENHLGIYCDNNSFGDGCEKNELNGQCHQNTLGCLCVSNKFTARCSFNILGKICKNNTFGIDCHHNILNNSCQENRFTEACTNNVLGEGCEGNNFNNNCFRNTFGNGCKMNVLIQCSNNSFGNKCLYNMLGQECNFNSFGNCCVCNSFRSNDSIYGSITVVDGIGRFMSSGNLLPYVKNVHYGDGCSDIVLYFNGQVSDTHCVKNINVSQGLKSNLKDGNGINIIPTFVNIQAIGVDFEWTIARRTSGEIVQFCLANLLK